MKIDGSKNIAGRRAYLIGLVDTHAEATRNAYVTPGAGQSQEYALTMDEATRLLAAGGNPPLTNYPMLAAELGAQASVGNHITIQAAALSVVTASAKSKAAMAQIKVIRRTAKLKLAGCNSLEDLEAVYDNLDWKIS